VSGLDDYSTNSHHDSAQLGRRTPDREDVLHTQRLLSKPDPEGLTEVLKTQHRLLEHLLFRSIELSALVDAGQHRFIGRALDDLEQTELELGRAELVRAAMTEAILGTAPGSEPALTDLLSVVDDEVSGVLCHTAERIKSTFHEIEAVRSNAVSATEEKVALARRAMRAASSESGLYTRR
jgi:hypothetical protein